ncbi:MAG: neutral zinc metallopeptidase, partial [Thermomicrobiales bacterium]
RFSVTWDRSWDLVAEQSDVLSEGFTLSNGTSTVRFRALLGFGGDSETCLDYVQTELQEETALSIVGDTGGGLTEPLSGNASTASYRVFRIHNSDYTRRSSLLYLDCQTLVPAESVLVGNVASPSREWPDERRELRKLWRSVDVFPAPLPGKSLGEAPLQAATSWFAADLLAFWTDAYDDAGDAFRQPGYEVFDDTITSECGQLWPGAAALYCGFDDRVYLDTRWIALNVLPEYGIVGVAYLMGHETAHGVQFQEGTVSFSRRQELQADCLAGAYMRSLVDADVFPAESIQGLESLIRRGGDDAISMLSGTSVYVESHGTGQQRWTLFRRGYEVGVAGCGLKLDANG